MKILSNRSTTLGSHIVGESVMINKEGQVYPTVDNVMHPNPGTAETEYDEIERTVDWMFQHNIRVPGNWLYKWLHSRTANLYIDLEGEYSDFNEDVVKNIMYSDVYTPCSRIVEDIYKIWQSCADKDSGILMHGIIIDEVKCNEKIATYLNENFLRVRAGGKLNPQGTNSIYFRISSHGYDWKSVIQNFLWDTFGTRSEMPETIWIGYDAKTHPPEKVLYEGTAEDLFEKHDIRILASLQLV